MEKLPKTFFSINQQNLKISLRKKAPTFKKHSSQSICMICEWVSAIFRLVSSESILSSHQKVSGVLRASDFRLTNVLLFRESKCYRLFQLVIRKKSVPKKCTQEKLLSEAVWDNINQQKPAGAAGKAFSAAIKSCIQERTGATLSASIPQPDHPQTLFLVRRPHGLTQLKEICLCEDFWRIRFRLWGCDENDGDDDDDGVGRNFPTNFEKNV